MKKKYPIVVAQSKTHRLIQVSKTGYRCESLDTDLMGAPVWIETSSIDDDDLGALVRAAAPKSPAPAPRVYQIAPVDLLLFVMLLLPVGGVLCTMLKFALTK